MSESHESLCERARRWLSGTRKCDPVFSNIASCVEIPDAIGWSSCNRWEGSTVVECKASVGDFYADKRKRLRWKHKDHSWQIKIARMEPEEALQCGYEMHERPLMGDFRFYMCYGGVLSADLVEKHAQDHGLLYVTGRSVRVVRQAPRRENVDKDGEIRYLRFAIINQKEKYAIDTERLGQEVLSFEVRP